MARIRRFSLRRAPARARGQLALLVLIGALIGTSAGTYAGFSGSTSSGGSTFSAAASFCTPGSVTVTANADTWVDEGNPTTSHGGSTSVNVRSWSAGPNTRNQRTLVRFALPALPAGCTVSAASLTLTTNYGATGRTIQAYRAAAAWNESTTWNSQPPTAGAAATAASVSSGPLTFDVTAQVGVLYSGTDDGFVLKDSAEDGGNFTQNFASSEGTASDRPQLAVSWN